MKLEDKPFIFWDGEAIDSGEYCLFGASTGERICYIDLSTIDCLSLILDVEESYPNAIHISFVFGYDVNQILKDVSFRHLLLLKKYGKCHYRGFNIEYIPRKWFVVSDGKRSAKIFDVFLFFNCSFGKALRKYDIGTPSDLDRIDKGKEERPQFKWSNIKEITAYWETELRYGVELMEKLRSIIYGAGFRISSWHGPGALASYALDSHNTLIHMDKGIPEDIRLASQYAMFGGRFQPFMAGFYDGPVYDRDINSAYAYSFSRLPSLANGKWLYVANPDPKDTVYRRMGLYHIRYTGKFGTGAFPLPHRSKGGSVCYPPAVEGWYHAPEAALVRNDPNAEFLEAWVFEDDGSYPFSWIIDAFHERQIMQERGDPSEKTIKWMLAALYGQAAQRAGWERTGKAPRWHQLEWAGAVTAECRAMIYTAAKRAKSSLVSIDTDGFISLAPVNALPNGCGESLGQWKAKTYTGLLYLQNGIYWLRDEDGSWLPPKSRGIPRKKLEFSEVLPMVQRNKNLEISQHMFIGFGLAMQTSMARWRTWVDIPRVITFGGNGKASHNVRGCPTCRKGIGWGEGMHPLTSIVPAEIMSTPHKLPWLTESIETPKELLKKWGIYDE